MRVITCRSSDRTHGTREIKHPSLAPLQQQGLPVATLQKGCQAAAKGASASLLLVRELRQDVRVLHPAVLDWSCMDPLTPELQLAQLSDKTGRRPVRSGQRGDAQPASTLKLDGTDGVAMLRRKLREWDSLLLARRECSSISRTPSTAAKQVRLRAGRFEPIFGQLHQGTGSVASVPMTSKTNLGRFLHYLFRDNIPSHRLLLLPALPRRGLAGGLPLPLLLASC
jgi:hypothetical protein